MCTIVLDERPGIYPGMYFSPALIQTNMVRMHALCMHVYVCMHACMCLCVYVRACACVRMCCVCMFVCVRMSARMRSVCFCYQNLLFLHVRQFVTL